MFRLVHSCGISSNYSLFYGTFTESRVVIAPLFLHCVSHRGGFATASLPCTGFSFAHAPLLLCSAQDLVLRYNIALSSCTNTVIFSPTLATRPLLVSLLSFSQFQSFLSHDSKNLSPSDHQAQDSESSEDNMSSSLARRAFCQSPLMMPKPSRNATRNGQPSSLNTWVCWLFGHRGIFILVFSPHDSLSSHLLLRAVLRAPLMFESSYVWSLWTHRISRSVSAIWIHIQRL